MKKTRFVLLGGFLGAGKTTLVGQLAKRYSDAGKRVGIITNDQAADLVDTNNLRGQVFDVGDVSGACFCCSFNDLVETADSLMDVEPPDVLLAEPVGSCTDLVATVVLPMQQLLGERFELAPFGVLLKPSHGKRILAAQSENQRRSGFSPQAEYIFRKQLEEADYLMIGRSDQLSDEQIEELRSNLETVAPNVPVVAVSPKTGAGIDEVLGYIESPMTAGRKLLEIDYDVYAEGEAELGWVNLTSTFKSNSELDLDEFASGLVGNIATQITSADAAIAHLKCSVLGGDTQAVANVVSNDSGIDVGLRSGRAVTGEIQVIVNARVAIDPDQLLEICGSQVRKAIEETGAEANSVSAHALRPGRPTPTHRVVS